MSPSARGQAQGPPVEDRSAAASEGALLPGGRGHQVQPIRQRAEPEAAGARQVPDGGDRGGDAQAHLHRLRRAQEWEAVRPGDKNCLTSKTVSNAPIQRRAQARD